MIISELEEKDVLDPKFMFNLMTETAKATIPLNVKKMLSSKEEREALLNKFGRKAFLLPDELKFPIINPATGKIDCKLLYAARIRAKQHQDKNPQYKDVADKAELLYQQSECSKKINIRLAEHEDSYDLLELVNLLELDFTDVE